MRASAEGWAPGDWGKVTTSGPIQRSARKYSEGQEREGGEKVAENYRKRAC